MPDEQHLPIHDDTDVYEDEEVPTVVLVVISALAILTVVLYMTVAGGHNHFH